MHQALFIWCKKMFVHDCNMLQIVVKHFRIYLQLENAFSYERNRKQIVGKENGCNLKTTGAISTQILHSVVHIYMSLV